MLISGRFENIDNNKILTLKRVWEFPDPSSYLEEMEPRIEIFMLK